jgi:hypothetical protein
MVSMATVASSCGVSPLDVSRSCIVATLLVALTILIGATRERLGYDVQESDREDMGFTAVTDDG